MDASKFATTTADRIRSHSMAQGIKSGELAKLAGMPYNTLRRYLSGERTMPLDVFYALCAALRVDPSQLVREAQLLVVEQSKPALRVIPGERQLRFAAHGDENGELDPIEYS